MLFLFNIFIRAYSYHQKMNFECTKSSMKLKLIPDFILDVDPQRDDDASPMSTYR